MNASMRWVRSTGILLLALSMVGCGSGSDSGSPRPADSSKKSANGAGSASPNADKTHPAAPDPGSMKRISDRPGNTHGVVFVTEYHNFKKGKGEMFRTPDEFRNDLNRLYKLGFRPVLASEYLANAMILPPGASPVVMTFDDAAPTQIQLDAQGNPTPDCAIGIWMDFAKTHPDFPVHGTFFVLPDVLWSGRKKDPRKVALLHRLGCELDNHTMTHPKLSKLSDAKVEEESGEASLRLKDLGATLPGSMALPYGLSPKNKALLKGGFVYKGQQVAFTGVFLNGAEPAKSPNDPKFDRFRVHRILATPVPSGLDDWLNKAEEGKLKLYVQP